MANINSTTAQDWRERLVVVLLLLFTLQPMVASIPTHVQTA